MTTASLAGGWRGRLRRWWGVLPVLAIALLLGQRALLHTPPLANLAVVAAEPGDPPGTTAYAGSIAITRGGPVIIGFQAPPHAAARLTFAGRELRGRGLVKERIIVPHGATALRFAAPPGSRLVWNPVGRRGDPEYVPASSLSPSPPDRATFDAPGTAHLDGAIALALLATIIVTLCVLARRRLAAVPRAVWFAMAGVLIVGLATRLYDLGGFGQTWDEDVNWASGRNYVTNLLGLDFSARAWQWNFEHPPVMKLLDGIGAQLADGFGPARALSAVWISLGCALLVPIGARLFSFRVGVLAAVIAALLPPLVAHGQIVGHESPTVLWWSLGILLALCAHDGLGDEPTTGRRTLYVRVFVIGVVVGIAVASRFVNGLLGPVCVAIVAINAPPRWRRVTLVAEPLMILGTLVAFYAVWPRLWGDPIGALQQSLAKLSNPHTPEPFLGAITNRPPTSYFLVYLGATLPVGVLVGVVAGLVRGALEGWKSWIVVGLWLVIPQFLAFSPVRQDGVRYVMPCLTALAMFAAAGFDFVARRLQRRVPHAFVGVSAAVVLYLGITLVRVHPYYLDYFGEHVGGAGGVANRRMLETAWWGEGLDRAVAYVNAHAEPGARVFRDCIEPAHLAWFREDLWNPMVRDPKQATWIVHYSPATRGCSIPADAREVFSVRHDGAALAKVYQRP